MERSKCILTVVLLLNFFSYGSASNKTEIYQSFISNKMDVWEKVIDGMQMQKIKSNDFLLELINYQYGYIAWCIDIDNHDLAGKYLHQAEENLAIIEKASYKLSMVNAYKSAFYGYRIGLNIFKAPFIGPKSVECAELSMKLDKDNPMGYIQYGNAQYYMPEMFGGSKTVALEYFRKAELLLELNSEEIKQDWNYLSLLTMMGKAYAEISNYNLAKVYYEKILKIEPNYLWVKNQLYPQLLTLINNNK